MLKIMLSYKSDRLEKYFLMLIVVLIFGYGAKNVLAQTSPSVLYVPLIGITSVPEPLSLPDGPGDVTYKYSVKNFLRENPLTEIQVIDDKCGSVKFTEGDDNNNGKLDYDETWRYACTTELSTTTESVATATGIAGGITATHKAYTTVIVGSDNPAPLVSIVNITKVAYPLSLPAEGGDITFTYRVNNPGVVALSNVSVTDDKCKTMSSKLGDTNANNLLDTNEVWVYTCTTHLTETTSNTASVTSYANSRKAVGYATITVTVAAPLFSPGLPNTGVNPNMKMIVWIILSIILVVLILFFFFKKNQKNA